MNNCHLQLSCLIDSKVNGIFQKVSDPWTRLVFHPFRAVRRPALHERGAVLLPAIHAR
jgi:hypothetical protein